MRDNIIYTAWNIASLNILVHNVIILLYYKYWTYKWCFQVYKNWDSPTSVLLKVLNFWPDISYCRVFWWSKFGGFNSSKNNVSTKGTPENKVTEVWDQAKIGNFYFSFLSAVPSGNWHARLQSVKRFLPFSVECGSINYLWYGSLCLEFMNQLPTEHEIIHKIYLSAYHDENKFWQFKCICSWYETRAGYIKIPMFTRDYRANSRNRFCIKMRNGLPWLTCY